MNKIIFHNDSLNERGTSVATYDYAYYLREYLNLEPIIVYDESSGGNVLDSVSRFQKEFKVIGYKDFNEVQSIIDNTNSDYFYWLKYGKNDHPIPKNAKTLVHSVFVSDPKEKHGDVYAVISEWMSKKSGDQIPYVPHMINLPNHNENVRKDIGIPADHIVIGRTGGLSTFNIPFVPEVMVKVLQKRNDIWFVLMNTPEVVRHERCIYVDRNVDLYDKVTYINTCDVMLHARIDGETFGLSVLEFATKNKQIISYDDEFYRDYENKFIYEYYRNHILYLNNNLHKYQNAIELENILLNITKQNPFNTEYLNQTFSPQNVIQKFNEVFLLP